jgi:hypothetical protein
MIVRGLWEDKFILRWLKDDHEMIEKWSWNDWKMIIRWLKYDHKMIERWSLDDCKMNARKHLRVIRW